MSDTIYRDDAIRIASGYCHPANIAKELAKLPSAQEHKIHFADADHVWIDGKQYISLRQFQEAVVEAQPEKHEERTETHECDLISRQAAIYAISKDIMGGLNYERILKELPSVQPEIIRCKDCKHFHYDMPYVIQGIPVLGHEVCDAWGDGCKTDENGYCFMAERRTNG